MIPTAVTSPPGGAILGFISNNSNDGNIYNINATTSSNNNLQNTTLLGIASLILEGRAFCDEECTLLTIKNDLICNVGESSYQSPKPSTSREACIDILKDSSELNSYLLQKLTNSNSSDIRSKGSKSAAFDSTDSRWTQKLSQLRQESPSIHASITEQKIIDCSSFPEPEYAALAINADHGTKGGRVDDDDDDFEIIRRIAINRINMYNAPVKTKEHKTAVVGINRSSVTRDGCMSSLQSLATSTCLRVGTPLINSGVVCNSKASTYRENSGNVGDIISMKKMGFSSGLLFSGNDNIDQYTRLQYWTKSKNSPNATSTAAAAASIFTKATVQWSGEPCSSNYLQRRKSIVAPPIIRVAANNSVNSITNANTSNTNATVATRNQVHKQGPHCDQFLRKMGLLKGGDSMDYEEHYCDMSYVNITCSRWRAYCLKMESIMAREEPVCIEVYLGPVGDKILLEQWIITVKEKQPPPTMTLPSLCSAIRSQLYFSQISAWCDLIKKSDKTIQDTGRFIFSTTNVNAAGDLATVRNTTNITTSTSSIGYNQKRLRLNIFYRIKQYDSTACFSSKPNVHNFPNVNISEDLCISVCLKSLPRISGGIPPKVGIDPQKTPAVVTMAAVTNVKSSIPALNQNVNCDNLQQEQSTTTAPIITTTTITTTPIAATAVTTMVMGNLQNYQTNNDSEQEVLNNINNVNEQQDAGGSSCFDGDSSNSSFSTNFTNLSHREKQLLKYRKRMLKRDKIQRIRSNHANDLADNLTDNHMASITNSSSFCDLLQSMDQGDEGDDEDELRLIDETNIYSSKATATAAAADAAEAVGAATSPTTIIDQRKQMPNMSIKNNSNNNNSNNSKINATRIVAAGNQVKMISTGTQTPTNSCRSCGNEKLLICLTCSSKECENSSSHSRSSSKNSKKNISASNSRSNSRNRKGTRNRNRSKHPINTGSCNGNQCNNITSEIQMDSVVDEIDVDSSASSFSSSDMIRVPRTKADLLLQAIQRTPKTAKKVNRKAKIVTAHAVRSFADSKHDRNMVHGTNSKANCSANGVINSNGSNITNCNINNAANLTVTGCQVCKRQKTQHDFTPLQAFSDNVSSDNCTTMQQMPVSANTTTSDTLSIPAFTSETETAIVTSAATAATAASLIHSETRNSESISNEMKCVEDDNNDDFVDNSADEFIPVNNNSTTQSCTEEVPHTNCNVVMDEECYETSTKLTPYIERCVLSCRTFNTPDQYRVNNNNNDLDIRDEIISNTICTQSNYSNNSNRSENTELSNSGDCGNGSSDDGIGGLIGDFEKPANGLDKSASQHFKTPTNTNSSTTFLLTNRTSVPPMQPSKKISKTNLLPIVHNYQHNDKNATHSNSSINNLQSNSTPVNPNPILLRRNLPKVNLTPIFCNTSAITNNSFANAGFAANASVSISPAVSPTSPCRSPSAVSKSLWNPRFYSVSTVYKRRSRNLSERSDRSSLGSDEQFSDEDTESGLYSPFATSPIKMPSRLSTLFERKPLLGNLEESLLQRRFAPKIEVLGFKLLLGASGGFCPTQLSIPASAYFYELQGDTLNTPYVCEVRLPRKGYTIPRFGTVQATLLNPMGTVVRMFVIPYDMRDMPALHQTFIRQRILADTHISVDSNTNNNNICGSGDSNTSITIPTTIVGQQQQQQQQQIQQQQKQQQQQQQQPRFHHSPSTRNESVLGHFISAECIKSLRYSIHLRFQTSRSGRLMLHTDMRLLIARRTDCDTAAAHTKGILEPPNELIIDTVTPHNPKYSARQQSNNKI